MKKICFVFGTRPEAIKLSPLIIALKKETAFKVIICITSQHTTLLQNVLTHFKIIPHHNLNIMQPNQTLFDITTQCLSKLNSIYSQEKPDLVVIQGDTTSAFSASLAAYYSKIPIAHIEAGLRTHQHNNPFPEEINRRLISELATYHFAPTQQNKENLKKENHTNNIWVVGNTGIDALKQTLSEIKTNPTINTIKNKIDLTKKIILVTGHRHENIGPPFYELCDALTTLSNESNLQIIFPIHLNPFFKNTVSTKLKPNKNLILLPPQTYPNFVWLMKNAHIIISDSGGIQEEAPFLGKPVLITRQTTERQETLALKNCKLINLEKSTIIKAVKDSIKNDIDYKKMSKKTTIYGNGTSSKKIVSILKKKLIKTKTSDNT